ncbi:AraC family transcriptional regulator [Kiritimatiellota bacterium B12222]|nr:AraC family transcriptional regulator [Kiritimatiellota bacterium B12222]
MDLVSIKSKISLFPVKLYRYPHLKLHTHPFHEFYFSLSTGGTQFAGEKKYPLQSRQLFILPASLPHYCHSDSETHGVEAIVLYVSPELYQGNSYADEEGQRILSRIVKMGKEGNCELHLHTETLRQIEQILLPLSKEKIEDSPGYAMHIRSGFESMLVALMRDPYLSPSKKTVNPMPHQRLEKVFYYLEAHYSEPLTVERVSQVAGLSRSHFHALFKQATGEGLVDYLTHIRIRRACELLQDESYSLLEVSMSCGFESLTHFYRCFRKRKGLPPGSFRKQSCTPS